MKKIIKSSFKVLALSLTIGTLFGTYAFAFGVSCVSVNTPQYVPQDETVTYSLELQYDTEIYGIPVPTPDCQIGAELPWGPLQQPNYITGSFDSMSFVTTTGDETGATVWQCYKNFMIVGTENKGYEVEATGDCYNDNGAGYVGVGAGHFGYDKYFSSWN